MSVKTDFFPDFDTEATRLKFAELLDGTQTWILDVCETWIHEIGRPRI